MADAGVEACWQVLETASIHDVASDDSIDEILGKVDWDLLMAAGLRHRLLPRVADFLIRSERMSFVPEVFRRALVRARHDNRYRCATLTREANRVVTALAEQDIVVACTKGIPFQTTLYGGHGGRSFEDIDLMILPESAERMSEALLGLGYQANLVHDLETDQLTSRSRQSVAMYRMYPDHLPHFVFPLSGESVPYYEVDTCFNITWFGAAWQIPMDEVLAERRSVEVTAGNDVFVLPALAEPYDFVFTAMHLFREAWFERTVVKSNLRIGQFADLWRQWHRLDAAGVAALAALVDRHAIAPPVSWVCHHLDQIFGSDTVGGLGLDEYRDPAWLHSVSGMTGSYLSWTGTMRERIRSGLPPILTPAAEPPFAADARATPRPARGR